MKPGTATPWLRLASSSRHEIMLADQSRLADEARHAFSAEVERRRRRERMEARMIAAVILAASVAAVWGIS